jgi:hypothetical protein
MRRANKIWLVILVAVSSLAVSAATASAASLSLSVSPSSPSPGQTVTVTISGTADRAGALQVYLQPAARACRSTGEGERTGNGGGPVYSGILYDSQISGPGPVSGSATFTAGANRSYRLCGYLGDYNDVGTPDASADRVVTTAGASGGSSGLQVRVSSLRPRAGRRVTVTVSGKARRPGAVFLYLNGRGQACKSTGEGERNSRVGKVLIDRSLASARTFRYTAGFTARRGRTYRLCAYLGGYNDTQRPDYRASARVRTRR